MSAIGKKSPPLRRDWEPARAKVDSEGACRNCGRDERALIRLNRTLEAAHVLGQEHDTTLPLDWDEDVFGEYGHGRLYVVVADRVFPLCGPATDFNTCHGADHRGELDKLRLLTVPEQLQAVADAGGIEEARVRLVPREVREAA